MAINRARTPADGPRGLDEAARLAAEATKAGVGKPVAPTAGVRGTGVNGVDPSAAPSEDLNDASALITRASRTIVAAFLLASGAWALIARSYGVRAVAAHAAVDAAHTAGGKLPVGPSPASRSLGGSSVSPARTGHLVRRYASSRNSITGVSRTSYRPVDGRR